MCHNNNEKKKKKCSPKSSGTKKSSLQGQDVQSNALTMIMHLHKMKKENIY